MHPTKNNDAPQASNMFCAVFGHNFMLSRNYSTQKDELICKSCSKKSISVDHATEINAKPKFREAHLLLERLHKKKRHFKTSF